MLRKVWDLPLLHVIYVGKPPSFPKVSYICISSLGAKSQWIYKAFMFQCPEIYIGRFFNYWLGLMKEHRPKEQQTSIACWRDWICLHRKYALNKYIFSQHNSNIDPGKEDCHLGKTEIQFIVSDKENMNQYQCCICWCTYYLIKYTLEIKLFLQIHSLAAMVNCLFLWHH